jgi:hypothetical protein
MKAAILILQEEYITITRKEQTGKVMQGAAHNMVDHTRIPTLTITMTPTTTNFPKKPMLQLKKKNSRRRLPESWTRTLLRTC